MKTAMSQHALIATLALLLPLAGCKEGHDDSHESGGRPHFTYEGATGPNHWGDLSTDWEFAKTGKSQSPIDLRGTAAESGAALKVAYNPMPLGSSVP